MNERDLFADLETALRAGRIGRRDFVRECLRVGLSASAAGVLLQACARDERAADGGEEALGDRLNIYNWSDYIADETIRGFEDETGVKVVYDTYESNEEMLAKIQAGATGYDVIVPSNYMVEILRASGLLAPLR
ncbi:MAG: polyamine ABC transporter substrate-binding protein, partial [Gemmatimonadota bacterium]